jgi:periplasmic protein TonB
LIAHLDKHKRYPSDRSMKNVEIVVGIVLDRMGRVLSTNIITGSGDTSFDDAAFAMMRRADPVPAPPPLVADEGLRFNLPVVFHVPKARTSQR